MTTLANKKRWQEYQVCEMDGLRSELLCLRFIADADTDFGQMVWVDMPEFELFAGELDYTLNIRSRVNDDTRWIMSVDGYRIRRIEQLNNEMRTVKIDIVVG